MTSVPLHPGVAELRELLRHLQEFRAAYEADGVDEVSTPQGNRWTLWDLEYLYQQSQQHLSSRQAQAIDLCLVQGKSEREVSAVMGIAASNPVAIYASQGLHRLIEMIENGRFARFRPAAERLEEIRRQQRADALRRMAEKIKSQITVRGNGCWVYPLADPRTEPTIAIRSSLAPSGFIEIPPLWVMYEALVASIPPRRTVKHRDTPWFFRGCANPEHGVLVKIEE